VSRTAIIGGTGLTKLEDLEITQRIVAQTPFGEPSGPLIMGNFHGREVVFLARHGLGHTIPPHRVNYRANIWALEQADAVNVIAIAAVGAINTSLAPAQIVFPDQIIDYTWSRGHTFFENGLQRVVHIDFTEPYCPELRETLIRAARDAGIEAGAGATYGATQGPRLETAAEIRRMAADGCDVVGMTGMPEAALARELELCYATCAVVANMAAGLGDGQLTMAAIEKQLTQGMKQVGALLAKALPRL